MFEPHEIPVKLLDNGRIVSQKAWEQGNHDYICEMPFSTLTEKAELPISKRHAEDIVKLINNSIILVEKHRVYGNERIYVVSNPHKEVICALTGKATIDERDVENLKKLGFSFHVRTQTI